MPLALLWLSLPDAPKLNLLILPLALLYGYNYLEYSRQAVFLGHSQACSDRYALLAALTASRGYDPAYGGLQKYKTYRYELMRRLFGRRARKIERRLLWLGIGIFILLVIWSMQ